MRRALCLLVMAAILLAALPQAALAISGQELLFGDGSADESSAAADSVSSSDYPTLQLGDVDGADSAAYIVFLQNRLIELGYFRESADGVYGESTQSAVLAFQKYNNLPETGVADGDTQRKLYSDISKLVAAHVEEGAFGGELTRVQTVLGLWGFYGGKIDGVTGSGTENAIRNFKSYMTEINPMFGVTPTPVPTATPNPQGRFADMPVVTDEKLYVEEDTSLTDATITDAVMDYVNGDLDFTVYRRNVAKGDRDSEALRVQTRLHQLKYVYAMDGVFGAVSELGLRYFQRKNNLPQTGLADEATQRILFSGQAVEAEEYVFPYKLVVDVSDQRVYVGEWTGASYEGPIHTFVCASGTVQNPTPLGTY